MAIQGNRYGGGAPTRLQPDVGTTQVMWQNTVPPPLVMPPITPQSWAMQALSRAAAAMANPPPPGPPPLVMPPLSPRPVTPAGGNNTGGGTVDRYDPYGSNASIGGMGTMGAPAGAGNVGAASTAAPAGVGYTEATTGTTPFTGRGSIFAPTFRDTLYDQPQAVLPELFRQRGIGTASPLYDQLANLSGADPMALYMILNGQRPDALAAEANYPDYLMRMYEQQMTPGGGGFNFTQGAQNLLNPGGDGSLLYNMLTTGDAPQQVRTMQTSMRDLARVSVNPLYQQALMTLLQRQGDAYMGQVGQGTGGYTGPFFDYLRENPDVMRIMGL
jgi:hypothetical protein